MDALEWPTVNTFSSPYYPDVYPVNTTCGWYITAPQNHIVELNLTSYYNSLIPSDDSVEVYDVEGSELSVISLHLRTESLFVTTIYSKFRSLYVLFKSGNKPETDTKGISVSYAAIKTGMDIYHKSAISPPPSQGSYYISGLKKDGVGEKALA